MPKFKSTEVSLYNGISQQSPELRLPSQAEDVRNATLTVARGVERRPPAELLRSDPDTFSLNSLVYDIPKDSTLSFMLVVVNESTSTAPTQVLDTDGNSYPVIYTDTSALDYIQTVPTSGTFNPKEHIKCATVLDTTFITNSNVKCAMSSAVAPPITEYHGYVWVKNGVQQVTRSVTQNGTTVNVGKNVNNDSEIVVDALAAGIAGSTRVSKSILYWTESTPMDLVATDSYSDTTMTVSKTSGTQEADLPPSAEDGDIFRIISDELADDDYYLKFSEADRSYSEVPAPAEQHAIDQTTMPVKMSRKIDDAFGTATGIPNTTYFEISHVDFSDRVSGDDDSSPSPSFIDKTIADVFFFKNRLGFVSGDGVILSATNDLFRFWPTTIKEVLDDDPIDVTISSNRNIQLSHAEPFPESLILLGDGEQFSLSAGSKPFTPSNVQLEPTTAYTADPVVNPVSSGSSLYFLAPMSNFTSLREYSVQADTQIVDAVDASGHVSQLIENNITQMISESNLGYLFLLNSEGASTSNELLVYKYFWQGNEKAQSAWSRWDLWFKPIGGITFGGNLYLVGTETIGGVDSLIQVRMNLRDKEVIIEDDFGNPFKASRPNIDRSTLGIDAQVSRSGNNLHITGQTTDYKELNIEGQAPTMVDRVTGESFRYVESYTVGDQYVFTTDLSVILGYTSLFILGRAPVGGGAIELSVANPSSLTFDSEDVTWDSIDVTWDQILI